MAQLYEEVNICKSSYRYEFTCFFHDKESIWALGGFKVADINEKSIALFKSEDNFDTHVLIQEWALSDLDKKGGAELYDYLTFHKDNFGNHFISARPLPKICRYDKDPQEPSNWQSIGDGNASLISFTNADSALLVPGWSVAESTIVNESGNESLMVIAEYGGGSKIAHHTILVSKNAERNDWIARTFEGQYRHIHCYQINPYSPNIHLISLGDDEVEFPRGDGWHPGLFVSYDSGLNWLTQVSVLPNPPEPYPPFNGPCTMTFLKNNANPSDPLNGSAFVVSDSSGQLGRWWGYGSHGQSWVDISRAENSDPSYSIEMLKALPLLQEGVEAYTDEQKRVWQGYPATTWSAIAVEGTTEIYGSITVPNIGGDDEKRPPMCIFRYIPEGRGEGSFSVMAHRRSDHRSNYISYGRGNLIPAEAKFVFSSAFGGIRIPRK
jgi:hypothetical protein